MKPEDIKDVPWIRLGAHAWTDAAFRAAAIGHFNNFVKVVNWAERWIISERIAGAGLDVPVVKGQVEYRMRKGTFYLVAMIERKPAWARVKPIVETSTTFPNGVQTSAMERSMLFGEMTKALNAEHLRFR